MHRERLHLSLQDTHPGLCHNTSHIWHDCVAEDLIDESVVAEIASLPYVLGGEAILHVWNEEITIEELITERIQIGLLAKKIFYEM